MAKAVLVLPEIPDGCEKCRLCVEDCFGGYFCSGTTFDEESYKKSYIKLKGKPDWCPLRETPGRIDGWSAYGVGWNDAVEEIEGSGKDGA